MKRDFSRTDRLNQLVHRELAFIIQNEMKDPRIGMVTISAVEITKDLSYAKVYVTILGDETLIKTSLNLLNKAAGFIRTQLAKSIQLRKFPELRFVYDQSVVNGAYLSDLIEHAIEKDQQNSKSDDE